MAIETALIKDIHVKLQLASCGKLLTFEGWSELATDIGYPGKGQVVKEAVYWLKKSSTVPEVTHTSPTNRQSDVHGYNGQSKHSISVALSDNQQKVLDRIAHSSGGRLTVIINGSLGEVLAEFFDVVEADAIIESFVKRGRIIKGVTQTKTMRITYTFVS